MPQAELQPLAQQEPNAGILNRLVYLLRGTTAGWVGLLGFDGAYRNTKGGTVSTGNAALHIKPAAAVAALLIETSAGARVVLIDDTGATIGTGKTIKLYDAAGVDHADLTADADGGLVLTGSGANAALLTIGRLLASLSDATNYAITAKNAGAGGKAIHVLSSINADLLVLVDASLTLSARLLATANDGANYAAVLKNAGAGGLALQVLTSANANLLLAADASLTLSAPLLFSADATYDVGAAGATRPRDLFLSRDATVGRNLSVVGGQIAFPAVQVPSAGANTLDDYEEGSWTPTIGATTEVVSGRYIKVGRTVHVWCTVSITLLGGSASATVVSGLPFAADRLGAAVVARVSGAVAAAVTWTAYVNGSTITVNAKNATNGTASADAINVFGTGTSIELQATYETAS